LSVPQATTPLASASRIATPSPGSPSPPTFEPQEVTALTSTPPKQKEIGDLIRNLGLSPSGIMRNPLTTDAVKEGVSLAEVATEFYHPER
jgi:hypothetical protein